MTLLLERTLADFFSRGNDAMMNVAANTAPDVNVPGQCAVIEAIVIANTDSALHSDCPVGSDNDSVYGGNTNDLLFGGGNTDICNGGTNTAVSGTASPCETVTECLSFTR